MDLSIITVTWNSRDLIGEQVTSVKDGCKQISCEQIIIDNASTDGTREYIKEQFSFVRLSGNPEGKGFGKANNQGVSIASGDFLLFLNPDMRVEEGSLDKIVNWMRQHSSVGLASCKLIDQHGNINKEAQPRRFPKVWEQVALILKIPHLVPTLLNRYHFADFDPDKEQEVDSVRGSFMIMRREVLESLGFAFDPRYHIWFEDVDLCREVKKLGYKVMHTPIISCVDYVGQSFKKRNTLWKQKQFTKSMLQYFKKWEPWYKWMWIAMVRPVGISMAWAHDKIYAKK